MCDCPSPQIPFYLYPLNQRPLFPGSASALRHIGGIPGTQAIRNSGRIAHEQEGGVGAAVPLTPFVSLIAQLCSSYAYRSHFFRARPSRLRRKQSSCDACVCPCHGMALGDGRTTSAHTLLQTTHPAKFRRAVCLTPASLPRNILLLAALAHNSNSFSTQDECVASDGTSFKNGFENLAVTNKASGNTIDLRSVDVR